MDLSSILTKIVNNFIPEGCPYERIEKGFFALKDAFDSDGKFIDPGAGLVGALKGPYTDIMYIFALSAPEKSRIIGGLIKKGYITLFKTLFDRLGRKVAINHHSFISAALNAKKYDLCIELVKSLEIDESLSLTAFISTAMKTDRLDLVKAFVEKDRNKRVKPSVYGSSWHISQYIRSVYN